MAQVAGLPACARDAPTLTRISPLLSDRSRLIHQGKARPLKFIKGQSPSCRVAPGHLLPVRAAATRRGSPSSTNGVATNRRPRADPWRTVAEKSSFVSDDGYPPGPGQGGPGFPEAAGPQQQQRRKLRVGEMAADMKRIRAQMEEDEQVASLMRGLRGQNLRDEQFADADVTMRLVQVETGRGDAEDALPLVYDPQAIADYWGRRPWAVAQRMAQLTSVSGGFLSGVAWDLVRGKVKENEVQRARELREIVTSLGPAYIKLGQALSIRPDVLSPAAMVELQKLCDKVPSFDTEVAMALIEEELGRPPSEIFSELTPSPIAAASLGQVYRGRLRETGEEVAVKVQRPYVLETVTIDLFIIRRLGVALRGVPQIATDVVGLVDEWAARFFEELDYVNEARNTQAFAESMAVDLPQVVVPRTYFEYTSRRVLVTEWINGEKLSQSTADDVGSLVNVGVICYLKQLLDTGLFHADPHPGNLIRTPDGRLCVLDFGLMTRITEDQKYGMIEAISHLIHRDYNAIVEDFVLLDFIPEGVNLTPIMPVLARVFDQALEGGGAKGINFQELAADLAQITFEYPFRIPPYFALIIRAIGVLEGIALVGDPDFAIVDAAYPYIAKRLLTDPSPRLRAALRYTIYGNSGVFDADRFIDVMEAFETFATNSQAGKGSTYLPPAAVDLDLPAPAEQLTAEALSAPARAPPAPESGALGPPAASFPPLVPSSLPFPLPLPFPIPSNDPILASLLGSFSTTLSASPDSAAVSPTQARAALAFVLSPEGSFFRDLILDEVVKALDAYSREQISGLAHSVLPRNGSGGLFPLPLFFPSPLASAAEALVPRVSDEDRAVLASVRRVLEFLSAGTGAAPGGPGLSASGQLLLPAAAGQLSDSQQQQRLAALVTELSPLLPTVAAEVAPEIATRLSSRVAARFLRDVFLVD